MLRTWCSRAGRRRATWKWSDTLVNFTDGVISMLKYVGIGSEVNRGIWEMKLLTLWPRLELGGSGTSGKNANHVIWKACSACVRGTCCFGGWLQSLLSTLLQLDVRSQSLCGPWFASLSTFLSSWCSVAVSPNPWNDVHFVLRVTATQPLIVFFENMFLSAAELFLVVFLVPARVLATLPCSSRRLCGILGCVHRRFPSLVILQRFEILLIVLRIKLDLVCALSD